MQWGCDEGREGIGVATTAGVADRERLTYDKLEDEGVRHHREDTLLREHVREHLVLEDLRLAHALERVWLIRWPMHLRERRVDDTGG